MYDLDLDELINTIEQRRKGLAYKIWRLASFTRHPFIKDFPETPQDACPELYPPKKTIPLEDWMIRKYYKKGDKQWKKNMEQNSNY